MANYKGLRNVKASMMQTCSMVSATVFMSAFVMGSIAISPVQAKVTEMVVTATKRARNLQDVPIAITAFTSEDLASRSAYKLTDITAAVAGVNLSEVNNTENSNSFTIRGLNTTFNNPGISPGVGVYVDGVYLARNAAFESALMDIERVEVLKGPQGTLFGKNTIQGAINIVTKKPSDEFEGTLSVSVGNYDMWQVQGGISGPLVQDKVSASILGYVRKRDGTVKDIAQGTRLNGQEYYGGRAKFYFTPNDNLDITISVDGQWDDTSSQTNDQYPIDYVVATSGVRDGEPQVFDRDVFGGSLEINYQVGDYTITSITGARKFEHFFANDQDFSTLRFLDITSRFEEAEWFSEELRVASPDSDVFDWVAGIYAYKQDGKAQVDAFFGPDAIPLTVGFNVNTAHEIESYAAFVNANWHITDQLTLNGGIRFTKEDQTFDFEQTGFLLFPSIPMFRQKLSSEEWSPTLGLLYAINDNINAYAKWSRGFKSGGFNNTAAFVSALEITAVDPEFVDSYEIGLKATFLDDRLRTNIAAFYIEYDDRQVSTFVNPLVGFAFANAAVSESSGFEVEVLAVPNDNLTLQLGVGYNNGDFAEFVDCAGPGTDCSGDPLGTPNWNVTSSIQYVHPLANGFELMGRLDGYYQDEPDVNPLSVVIPTDARIILNARAALISSDNGWEIAIWGRNLTKDDGTIYTESFIGEQVGGLPEPRTYGIDATFKF